MKTTTIRRLGWALVPAIAVAFLSVNVSASPDDSASGPAKATPVAPGAARPAAHQAALPSSGSRATSILGSAWELDNTPIMQANVRLRNVVTGKIEAAARADDNGQFAFQNIEGGSYVVELLSEAGRMQTVGHVFTIAPGETVATFVRREAKAHWAKTFFSNAASAVASAAASEGITAMTPLALCVSPPGCK